MKRFLRILSVIAICLGLLLPTAMLPICPMVYAVVAGDVDGNGKVESADARFALRASVGLEHYPADSNAFIAADADNDGKITSADARLILRASVGLETLAMEKEIDDFFYLTDFDKALMVTDGTSAVRAAEAIGDRLAATGADVTLSPVGEESVDTYHFYRLQQLYKGIPVEGKTVTVSADKTGNVFAITANTDPAGDIADVLKNVETSESPKPGTVIFPLDGRYYICTISYDVPNGELYKVYTDTVSGREIYRSCMVYTEDYLCQENDSFLLYDEKRNLKALNANNNTLKLGILPSPVDVPPKTDFISLYTGDTIPYAYDSETIGYFDTDKEENCSLLVGLCDNVRFISASSVDHLDQGGVTLMQTAEKVYDYFFDQFHREGYDNLNNRMYLCCNDEFDNGKNAYSTAGFLLSFGSQKDLSSVDLVAHEYMHSVEYAISDMKYAGESGSIKEAFSDIFGELAEDYIDNGQMDGSCNWIHGDRSLCETDPERSIYPSQYQGKNFLSTIDELDKNNNSTNDHGHVHRNSTVISRVAYRMWNGIDGTKSKMIPTKLLQKLWFDALLLMPKDASASFKDCAVNLMIIAQQMAADHLLSQQQLQCVHDAFAMANISTFAPVVQGTGLVVYDEDNNPYDNYHIKIKNRFTRQIVLDTDVSSTDSVKLEYPVGYYYITVTDNAGVGSKKSFTKTVMIKQPDSVGRSLPLVAIFTDFAPRTPELAEGVHWFGDVVSDGKCVYYWKYNQDSFSQDEVYYGNFTFSRTVTNKLICRRTDGSESTVFSDTAAGKLCVANGRIYYQQLKKMPSYNNHNIVSRKLDGTDPQEYGDGVLSGVTGNGRYLMIKDTSLNGGLRSLDTVSGTMTDIPCIDLLVCSDNYSVILDNDPEKNLKDDYAVYRINGDGSGKMLLYINRAKELLSSGKGTVTVKAPYVYKEVLYYFYERYAGTGNVTQSGSIIRIDLETGEADRVEGSLSWDSGALEQNKINVADSVYRDYLSDLYHANALDMRDYISFSNLPISGYYASGNAVLKVTSYDRVGEKVYVLLTAGVFSSNNGSRVRYRFRQCALFEKDLDTGKAKMIYSSSRSRRTGDGSLS